MIRYIVLMYRKTQHSKDVIELVSRFNTILIKIVARFVCWYMWGDSKFIWKVKVTRITEMTLKKKKVEGIILPGFKMYYKPLIMNTVCDISKAIDTCISTTEYESRNSPTCLWTIDLWQRYKINLREEGWLYAKKWLDLNLTP